MPISSSLRNEDIQKITRDDPRLWNMSDLAKILGVNRSYITRMKNSGFRMPGNRASLKSAHAFLEKCEDFSPFPAGKKDGDDDASQMVAQ